jgi:multidrug resistance protein
VHHSFTFSSLLNFLPSLSVSIRVYVESLLAMAAPEIDLAEDDLGHISEGTIFDDDHESKANLRDDLTSDSTEENRLENVLDGSSPIIYHYLTFQIDLPLPSTSSSIDPAKPPLPPQPNLKNFTSPFDWPESRKNFMVWLSCIATLFTAYTAGSYSPAVGQMTAEWHVSEMAALVGITSFCCGFGIAPMVLAPFSEIQGRYPVFVGAGIVFLICQLCCAVTRSYAGMIVARFWVGCGSSVFSTMVGGVVSDLYHARDRNTPMALFSGGALFGTGLGPLVSGFIAQNTNWRWVFWVQVITCGILVSAVTLFFKETRGSILLSKKARCLNKWYEEREHAGYIGFDMPVSPGSEKTESQRIRWKVKSDEERESISRMIGISVYRPFHLLVTEPVVFFFSLVKNLSLYSISRAPYFVGREHEICSLLSPSSLSRKETYC